MYKYQEVTNDNGTFEVAYASDNNADYYLTSARAKDLMTEFRMKHDRYPTARWLNAHIRFKRVKEFCGYGHKFAE